MGTPTTRLLPSSWHSGASRTRPSSLSRRMRSTPPMHLTLMLAAALSLPLFARSLNLTLTHPAHCAAHHAISLCRPLVHSLPRYGHGCDAAMPLSEHPFLQGGVHQAPHRPPCMLQQHQLHNI